MARVLVVSLVGLCASDAAFLRDGKPKHVADDSLKRSEDKSYWDRLLQATTDMSIAQQPSPTPSPTPAPVETPTEAPPTGSPPATDAPPPPPTNPVDPPTPAPVDPTPTDPVKFCIDFDCGDGYRLRENPETRPGDDRETCCYREGVCAGAPEGAPCSLGDIGSSLIPNPSFEEYTSCPTSFATAGDAQLDRAVSWVQATDGTSDYLVGAPACDDSWWRGDIPSQSASDGDAFVGGIKQADETYYEYIGACLITPLVAGVDYTFNLDVAAITPDAQGFGGDTNGNTDLLCIPNCDEFQISGFDYKGDIYEVLATATPAGGLVGGGEWKSITFVATPTQDCPAIMFGPAQSQSVQAGEFGSYVLYDFLNLQEGVAGVCNTEGECVPATGN